MILQRRESQHQHYHSGPVFQFGFIYSVERFSNFN